MFFPCDIFTESINFNLFWSETLNGRVEGFAVRSFLKRISVVSGCNYIFGLLDLRKYTKNYLISDLNFSLNPVKSTVLYQLIFTSNNNQIYL
jgi:hypothetical protein